MLDGAAFHTGLSGTYARRIENICLGHKRVLSLARPIIESNFPALQ